MCNKTFCKDCGGIELDDQDVCHCNETNEPPRWRKADDPPDHFNDVVVITNFGDVFVLSHSREGWELAHRFNKGEKVEYWIEQPKPDSGGTG